MGDLAVDTTLRDPPRANGQGSLIRGKLEHGGDARDRKGWFQAAQKPASSCCCWIHTHPLPFPKRPSVNIHSLHHIELLAASRSMQIDDLG